MRGLKALGWQSRLITWRSLALLPAVPAATMFAEPAAADLAYARALLKRWGGPAVAAPSEAAEEPLGAVCMR